MQKLISEVEQTLMVLLNAIQMGDIETYQNLVDPELTCFEPETHRHMVKNLTFHEFLIKRSQENKDYNIELVGLVIKILSDSSALATYSLLITKNDEGKLTITSTNETRIFQKNDKIWKLVHLHRS